MSRTVRVRIYAGPKQGVFAHPRYLINLPGALVFDKAFPFRPRQDLAATINDDRTVTIRHAREGEFPNPRIPDQGSASEEEVKERKQKQRQGRGLGPLV